MSRAVRVLPATLACLAASAGALWAHAGRPPAPHDLWRAWTWEPGVLAGVFASAWLYSRGTERLWARAGVGRGVRRRQAACFAAGLALLLVALVSPLDALGGALFSAHMAQHELLILGAAPLLVLGTPLVSFVWGLPPRWRRRLGRWTRAPAFRRAWRGLTHPVAAWVVFAGTFLLWHVPAAYQRSVRSDPVHALQHATFLGAALLFWWALLHDRRLGPGPGVLYLFAAGSYGNVLGALLTFSSSPWYPVYDAARVAPWGLTPLQDQQLGGVLMWVPGSLVYLGAALSRLAVLLRGGGRRARARAGGSRAAGAVPLLLVLLLGGCGGQFEQDVLDPRGPGAERAAVLWWVMFAVGSVVFLGVLALFLGALSRRRTAPEGRGAEREARLTRWVAAGVGATVAILVGVLALGLVLGRNGVAAEDDPDLLRVEVVGHRFWWEVRYPGRGGDPAAVTANELHLPVGRPVRIEARTADVIHSFWVPNLAGKVDMVPGRTNRLLLRADRAGVYRGQCAEFCGVQHAKMAFVVVAEPEAEFAAWLARQRRPAPEPRDSLAERGRRVFVTGRCAGCHTVRGTPADGTGGPDLTHLAGRQSLAAGTLPNSRGHLGGWIADPQRIKPGNDMPYVPLEGRELRAVLHYLETLE